MGQDQPTIQEHLDGIEIEGHESYGTWDYVDSVSTHFTAISAPVFEQFFNELEKVPDEEGIILSPELITITPFDFLEIPTKKEDIEILIKKVVDQSVKIPNKLIVLGSPYWFPESSNPVNAAVVIQNGSIVSVIPKRTNVDTEEFTVFDFSVKEIPSSLHTKDNTGVLICSDLANASTKLDLNKPGMRQKLERLQKHWVRSYEASPTFIQPEWKTIVVLSIWGVGGHPDWAGITDIDAYYRNSLLSMVYSIFKDNPQIMDIVICMRAPLEKEKNVSTIPFNYHIKRAS